MLILFMLSLLLVHDISIFSVVAHAAIDDAIDDCLLPPAAAAAVAADTMTNPMLRTIDPRS